MAVKETKRYLDKAGLDAYHSHIDSAFKTVNTNINNINDFIIANLGKNTFKDTPESWLDGWYFDQTGILEPQPSWVSTPLTFAYPGNTITVAWHDETVDKVITIRANIWNNGTYLGFKYLNDYNSFVMPPGATHYALSINKAGITATERHPKLYIMVDDPLALQLKKIKQSTKAVTYFGISETAADDGNKQANIPGYNPDDLTDGLQVNVLFKNGNTANGARLYINNTSSGFIAFGKISDSSYKTYGGNEWDAGDLVTFTYVSPYWILDNHIATTSTYGYTKLDNTLTDSEKTVPTTKLLKDTTGALVYGKVQSIGTINDLNNLVQTGFYVVETAGLAHAPNTLLNRYNVTVTSYTRYIIQEVVGVIGSTTQSRAQSNVLTYYRMKDTILGEWTAWKRVADMDDVDSIPKFAIAVVDALPTEQISSTTIYLLKTSETETGNLYTEYIYVNNAWESLGTQTMDLSGYMKNVNPSAIGTFSLNRKGDSAIGMDSVATGRETEASGSISSAEGRFSKATGFAAHAEGETTIASGRGAHAEGIGAVHRTIFLEAWQSTAGEVKLRSPYTNNTDHTVYIYPGDTIAINNAQYGYTVATQKILNNLTLMPGQTGYLEYESFYVGYQSTYPLYNIYLNSTEEYSSKTTATGDGSHAEGAATTASGNSAHSEGNRTIAVGFSDHAEGSSTYASGSTSHAEGSMTTASGQYSHSEGNGTYAWGNSSHAEGNDTYASSSAAHVEGYCTTASGQYSHVQGKFNIVDTANKYAHIVGNGTSKKEEDRSNAHTLDWEGNAWYAGDVTGTDENGKDISLRAVAKLISAKNLWASNESYDAASSTTQSYYEVKFSEALEAGDYTLSFLGSKIVANETAAISGVKGINQTTYFSKTYTASEVLTETKLSITTSAMAGQSGMMIVLRNLKIRNIQLEKGSTSTIYVAPGISDNLQKSISDAIDSNTAVIGETLFIG